uniref:Uncharacterized protein n=1 Tax=Leersia perrieri TaxID=77586 RepID=A0A0D9VWG5_9ORYZ
MHYGRTSLLKAVHSGHQEIAKYLLDHGANPDQAMRCGLAPLHSAAGLGDCESVKQLLAKGAYVDPVCTHGTPLHLAAHEGQNGTMKILLDHNADCNKIINRITPLLLATRSASAKCMELLVEILELNIGHVKSYDYLGATFFVLTFSTTDRTLSDTFVNYMSTASVDDGDSGSSDSGPREVGANHHVSVNNKIAEFKSLGLEAVEKKDYRSAAGFYSKAMELDPDDATLLSNRSLCWLYMVMEARLCWMLMNAEKSSLTGLRAATDYAIAYEALYDGFTLDPGNIEIENALR